MAHYPIYVPSKGRATLNNGFLSLCASEGVVANITVEPQEHKEYFESWGRVHQIIALPNNDRGLPFSRNFIKRHANENGAEWFWMIDDDIRRVLKNTFQKKVAPHSLKDTLSEAEKQIKESSAAVVSLEYRQNLWAADGEPVYNTFNDSFVCINTQRTRNLFYRECLPLKHDRDFSMQNIYSGNSTMRLTTHGFELPPNGSNAGGLKDVYCREEEAVDKMIELWGENIVQKQIKPGGRIDCKIHWNRIAQSRFQKTLF